MCGMSRLSADASLYRLNSVNKSVEIVLSLIIDFTRFKLSLRSAHISNIFRLYLSTDRSAHISNIFRLFLSIDRSAHISNIFRLFLSIDRSAHISNIFRLCLSTDRFSLAYVGPSVLSPTSTSFQCIKLFSPLNTYPATYLALRSYT